MNSIIVKLFVFVNETLALVVLGIGALIILIAGATGGFIGFSIALAIFLVFLFGFGFGCMMIENHKLLKQIVINTRGDRQLIEGLEIDDHQ